MTDDIFESINTADMSPTEFEKYCMELFKVKYKKFDNLFIEHNKIIKVHDGKHQIDVYIEYTVADSIYKTFVECKHISTPVEKRAITDFYQKIQSCGAHKGLFITTSSYQSGAKEFAIAHGISLYRIFDSVMKNIVASTYKTNEVDLYVKKRESELLPKYYIVEYDSNGNFLYNDVYPTKEMRKEVNKTINNEVQAKWKKLK